MAEPPNGFRRMPGQRPRPVAQGIAAMIAAVAVLGGGLLANRLLSGEDDQRPPAPSPSPSKSAA
ncbi:hypothetical protein KZ829_20595 [Actinoplanes hulinensis]|uniref:Uncharacterized protein n=1 Tax=Actinoplanes hulinensis TaxID=1144547 RepID=A0ABS7B525_9ACTN|nr:hypothetical protein [Actinoplanes hulinensis]MBW6436141.1 hypothetical protein [Actinoplanes hulinensis]